MLLRLVLAVQSSRPRLLQAITDLVRCASEAMPREQQVRSLDRGVVVDSHLPTWLLRGCIFLH